MICHAKPGDTVSAGQPLLTLYGDDEARFARALESLDGAYEIEDGAAASPHPLIIDRIA